MSTRAKIILDKRSTAKKGHPISIYLYNNGTKYIPLGKYSHESDWDIDGPKKSHPDYTELHRFLLKRRVDLIGEVDYCNEHNLGLKESYQLIKNGLQDRESRIAALKRELRELEGQGQTMLFEFWETYIKDRERQKKSTKATIDTKAVFENFLLEKDMPINDITYEFLNEFIGFKMSNKCGTGGVSFYLRSLRSVYLEAQRRESLKIKSTNPFKGLINEKVSKDPVEMSQDEMVKWKNFVPHKFTREYAAKLVLQKRDIFLFQFYIGGHDFVDIALLEWKNIRNGRIRFKRYKNRRHTNGGPTIDNILVPEALAIIEKHGTKNRDRIFSFIPEPRDQESYQHYINNYRRALRKMSEQLKLNDVMKSKSPRYIFRTWAGNKKADMLATIQIQGQVPKGVTFRYQARLPNEMIDKELSTVIA